MLHLHQMRTSQAFKSFYSNASYARIAVDRMFTHPDWGFAYPDQDIHTALALLHPVRPWLVFWPPKVVAWGLSPCECEVPMCRDGQVLTSKAARAAH